MQVDHNHDKDIDFNINIVENQSHSIVNFNDQHTLEHPEELVTEYDEQVQQNKNRDNNEVQCHCGKLYKGDRGLRAHQRFGQISDVPELREIFNKDLLENSLTEYDNNIANSFIPPKLNPKVGIKPPKTREEGQISNDYFKSVFNLHGNIRNVEEEIIYLQNTLYDYSKVQYGTIKNDDLNTEYKRQLKKSLANLKQQSDDRNTSEIRYTSKLIRSKHAENI